MSDTDNGNGSVRITNREIYDKLLEVEKTGASLQHDILDVLRDHVELKARIRSLELKFYGILAGVLGGMAIIIQQVIAGAGNGQ